MSVAFILFIVLFILMILIGGERGAKSFFTLILNFFIVFFMIILVAVKVDAIKVAVIGCAIITYVTLFFINGFNKKTISALIAVTIVLLLTIALVYKIGQYSKVQGFGYEQLETLENLSLNVQIDFSKIVICEIVVGLLGAIIDVAISISSSMNEIYLSYNNIKEKELFIAGMNIGKDILGTMTNTVLFAFIGSFMTLIIYFNELNYKFIDILNTKVFCAEVFQMIAGGIGIVMIIPVSAFITSKILFRKGEKIDLEVKTS